MRSTPCSMLLRFSVNIRILHLVDRIPIMRHYLFITSVSYDKQMLCVIYCAGRLKNQILRFHISHDTKAWSRSISSPFLVVAPCSADFFMKSVSSGL